MSEALALHDVLHACGDAGSQLYNFGNRVSERLKTWSSRDQGFLANDLNFAAWLDQRFRDRGDITLSYCVLAELNFDTQWRIAARIAGPGGPVWGNYLPVTTVETTAEVCSAIREAVREIEAAVLGDDFLRAVFPAKS